MAEISVGLFLQQQYVGLDVLLETNSVCVIDEKRAVIRREQVCRDPGIDRPAVRTYASLRHIF